MINRAPNDIGPQVRSGAHKVSVQAATPIEMQLPEHTRHGATAPLLAVSRIIDDPRLIVSFSDISTLPKTVVLAPLLPILFSPRDHDGRPLAVYELLSSKLSPFELVRVGDLLSKAMNQPNRREQTAKQGGALELLSEIVTATADVQDAWLAHPVGGLMGPETHPPHRMEMRIPSLSEYLKDPSQLGTVYHSRSHECAVTIKLDPNRNQAIFRIANTDNETAPEEIPKTTRIVVPGPVQGAMGAGESLRHLRAMSWHALETLWEHGAHRFRQHLKQLKAYKPHTHIKNFSTGASLEVFATTDTTRVVLASRQRRVKGAEPTAGAYYQWSFPGNMEHPDHPLHSLLMEIKKGVRRPGTDGRLVQAITEFVKASQEHERSHMVAHPAPLTSLFDPPALHRLERFPGITIQSIQPGSEIAARSSLHDGILPRHNEWLSHAIADLAHGISRVRVTLADESFVARNPQAFDTLLLDIYPDRSVFIRAKSNLGISPQCFLSASSRFVPFISFDGIELVCAAFSRQVIKQSAGEGRIGFLQLLQQLVQMDRHNSYLEFAGSCVPPSIYDHVGNALFDSVAIPLAIQLQDACGMENARPRIVSRSPEQLELFLTRSRAPYGLQILFSHGILQRISVIERAAPTAETKPAPSHSKLTMPTRGRHHFFPHGTEDLNLEGLLAVLRPVVGQYVTFTQEITPFGPLDPAFIGSSLHTLLQQHFIELGQRL